MKLSVTINLQASNVSHCLAMIEDLKANGIVPSVQEPSIKRTMPAPYIDAEMIARQDYRNKFGKSFRLRKGQDESNITNIIITCIESGIDNGRDASIAGQSSDDETSDPIIDDGRDVFA